jgi:hypothetical protein
MPLLIVVVDSLLNLSEIELEQTGGGQLFKVRLDRVRTALPRLDSDPAYRGQVEFLTARSKFLEANALPAQTPEQLRQVVDAYNHAVIVLQKQSPEAVFLRGRILLARGLARQELARAVGEAAGQELLKGASDDLNKALEAFEQSAAKNVNSPPIQREILAVLYRISDTQDFALRMATLESALGRVNAMPAAVRDSVDIDFERSRILASLAITKMCLGRLPEARDAIDNAVSAMTRLVGLNPGNSTWVEFQREISRFGADLLKAQGRGEAAAQLRRRLEEQRCGTSHTPER